MFINLNDSKRAMTYHQCHFLSETHDGHNIPYHRLKLQKMLISMVHSSNCLLFSFDNKSFVLNADTPYGAL